jgi:class 3 adenylate cyclase
MVELTERHLCIVLLDLIGSTAFVEKHGAYKAAQWLQYHDKEARSLLYKFKGREIDRSDGFLLSFEAPVNALNFALWYQITIPAKTKLACRIGIHYGPIVEVKQEQKYSLAGAKNVELEGISKNIAARTMSLCGAGQVLLTQEAFKAVRNRANGYTPKLTRFACVGLYQFKGVKEPQTIYAVGISIESLQPPPSSEKVKRLGGPKKIRSRARDRKLREWFFWFMWRIFFFEMCYVLWRLWIVCSNPHARLINGLGSLSFIQDLNTLIQGLTQ